MIFAMTWERYEKDLTTDTALEQRAKQLYRTNSLEFAKHGITESGIVDIYKKNLNAYTQRIFEHDYDTFFMLDIYPELKDTIECPRDIAGARNWIQQFKNKK